MTTLQLLGNACTLLSAPDGTRIVSDPYGENRPPGLAPLPPGLKADAVTVSHVHPDHNNTAAVGGTTSSAPRILTEPGTYRVGGVWVTGWASREGSPHGPSELRNVIFIFEAAGVKIVHMGDGGIIAEPEIRTAVSGADVVLVNIDGYVLPLDRLMEEMDALKARTIIPTHFSVSAVNRWATEETYTLDEYLTSLPAGIVKKRMTRGEIEVNPGMPRQVAGLPYTLIYSNSSDSSAE